MRAGRALEAGVPVLVHPFEMHRIAGVLLALKPVAGDLRDHDLGKAVAPGQRLPHRQFGGRLRPQIGPQQAAGLLDRIGAGAAALAAAPRRVGDVVIGLLDAAPVRVHQPAVIVAADAGLLDEAERQIGAPVRALPVDQPEAAAAVAVEHQILAEQPHRLDGGLVELGDAGDRHPVAPQVVAHRRARPHLREQPVVFSAQHLLPPLRVACPGKAQHFFSGALRSGTVPGTCIREGGHPALRARFAPHCDREKHRWLLGRPPARAMPAGPATPPARSARSGSRSRASCRTRAPWSPSGRRNPSAGIRRASP